MESHAGFILKTPQNEAGRIVDPPVCVTSASTVKPSATAAANPEDEPPGVRDLPSGLVVPCPTVVDANSDVVTLAAINAPAYRNVSTQAASITDTCSA
jgi:hypothetical protein